MRTRQSANAPARPNTLYVREDELVDHIHSRLGDQGDGSTKLKPDQTRSKHIATALRDSGQFIIYDSTGWRLQEIDSS